VLRRERQLDSVPSEQMVNVPDCGAFDGNYALSTFVVPHDAM
jgi:hypothetical protein